MADTKISALSAVTAALIAQEIPVNDAGTSKKLTLTQIITLLQQSYGLPRVKTLTSQFTVASTTGAKVTGLDMTLEPGTYTYLYSLIVRSATAADGPQFGVNFSGTAAVKTIGFRFYDATTAISAEVHIMDNVGIKTAGFVSGMCHNAYSTTSPNLGTTVGVTATGVDIPCFIEGVLVVTAGGDLQLYEGCEGTNQATVQAGASLVVTRVA